MSTKTKVVKLMSLWNQTPEEQEEKVLKLELSASEISAKGDLLKAQVNLQKQEEKVLQLRGILDELISRVGKEWSPADIINARIDLEEKEEVLNQLKNNITEIEELMKEYLY